MLLLEDLGHVPVVVHTLSPFERLFLLFKVLFLHAGNSALRLLWPSMSLGISMTLCYPHSHKQTHDWDKCCLHFIAIDSKL